MSTCTVSVIIPVFNKWELTEACLQSLALQTKQPIEVIVVDNCSEDMTPHACPALGAALFGENFVYLRQNKNCNFAPACNIGARAATGTLLFFLNNDTVLLADWLPPLLAALEAPPYPSMVAPLLLYPRFAGRPERIQHLGLVFEPQLYPAHLYEGFPAAHPACKKVRRYQALTGAALLIPKRIFIESGLFDEDFINGGEDVELGLRLSAAGHILTCVPEAKIYHLASQTPGIHAHAAQNAVTLKEKAMQFITPDLHFFAEKDGYTLGLTPGLKVYLDLPARRKEIMQKRVAAARSAQELEALIESEPVCHAAYPALAALYHNEGNIRAAADTLYLALRLRSHPELAQALAPLAAAVGDKGMLAHAERLCIWYNTKDFAEIHESATFMRGFTQQLGMTAPCTLYEHWLHHTDAMRRFFGNQPAPHG